MDAIKERDPYKIIKELLNGNLRYLEGLRLCDVSALRRASISHEQNPIAAVLGCSDSRVPPEHIFDKGLGELFVIRTAGHVVGEFEIGSLEYACKHLKIPLILVLGHTGCGAVKAAVSGVKEEGGLNAVIDGIKPAVVKALTGASPMSHDELVNKTVLYHVKLTVSRIMDESEIIRKTVQDGGVAVMGAVYDLYTGRVSLLD
ncbi:MAG: carbonic anhydrase [Candidatus Odinarchaeota archaeon]